MCSLFFHYELHNCLKIYMPAVCGESLTHKRSSRLKGAFILFTPKTLQQPLHLLNTWFKKKQKQIRCIGSWGIKKRFKVGPKLTGPEVMRSSYVVTYYTVKKLWKSHDNICFSVPLTYWINHSNNFNFLYEYSTWFFWSKLNVI